MISSSADAQRRLPLPPNRALDHLPGGTGRPLFGHTLDFVRNATALVESQRQRYGAVFTLRIFGYPIVIVGDPDAVKTVFMDRERNFSNRLGWSHAIGELFARGLMLRDFDEHRVHRRIMQVAFRTEAMQQYTAMMNPLIASGIAGWHRQPELRFYPAVKQLTLDLAAAVFLGLPLGDEADGLNRAFVDSVAASIALIKREVPGLSYRRGMNGRRRLERFFAALVPERRAAGGDDMLSQLCTARSEQGEEFSDRDVVDHMIFLMMAAHDTTTSSLTTMIWALAQHPEWQERLRRECAALGKAEMGWDDKDHLVETEWVLKEALRLYPPVPFIARRTLRECTLGDLELPVNTGISICALITHKLPTLWHEPDRFDPERFSPNRAEHRRHSHGFYPFGGGAHTCLGMHFATLQVKAFVHQFLQRYRVSLAPGQKVTMLPIPIPKPKEGLPVRLELIER